MMEQWSVDEVMDRLAEVASWASKGQSLKTQRAIGAAALAIIGNILWNVPKHQDDAYDKLLQRWARVSQDISKAIREGD